MEQQIGFYKALKLTSVEFEKLVADFLQDMKPALVNSKVQHNVKLPAADGIYQIDVFVEFEMFGATFRVLIECKHQQKPIERDVVQLLHAKLNSTGSQKGMLFATTGFQRGALKYASEHGIALIQCVDGKATYETRSAFGNAEAPHWVSIPKFCYYSLTMNEAGSARMSSVCPSMFVNTIITDNS